MRRTEFSPTLFFQSKGGNVVKLKSCGNFIDCDWFVQSKKKKEGKATKRIAFPSQVSNLPFSSSVSTDVD